jgi:hypothetical protein
MKKASGVYVHKKQGDRLHKVQEIYKYERLCMGTGWKNWFDSN